MGAYTIFFFSTCRTMTFPFSILTDTSETPRLLNPYSIAAFSFSPISTFKPLFPPSHLFSETGTPYLVASCGVEPLSCGSKPPALPLSYLAVHPRLSGVSAPWPSEHSASWSPQSGAATSQDSKRLIFSCPQGAKFRRMEGATFQP